MRIGHAASYQSDLAALQLLRTASPAKSGRGGTGASAAGFTASAPSTLQTYSAGGTPPGSRTNALLKTMAASPTFANAANGVADDQVRALVRDGKIAQLPLPKDFDPSALSSAEQNVYHVVQGLQSLYDAQPKTLDDALAAHVKTVIDTYPDAIARMKDGLASGTLPASDGWTDVIASYESELAAAQQGRMKITAIDDPGLVHTTNEFSISSNGIGWSGRGTTTTADIPALQQLTGTKNVVPGGSPYTGSYVISW